MKFSIISIGTELNLGLIVNTNSKYIAEKLTDIGLECNYMITVRDNYEDIINSLNICSAFSEIIIISGGLGPTDDDMTREAISKFLNCPLYRDSELDKTSLKFLKYIKNDKIIENLKRQSFIPEGSIPIIPRIGSASGFAADYKGKKIFVIPGVPREMKDMFENDVMGYIEDYLADIDYGSGKDKTKGFLKKDNMVIKKSVLLSTDISESQMEFSIREIKPLALSLGIEIGVTANPGLIKIMLIARAVSLQDCDNNLKIVEQKIIDRIGQFIYWRGEGSIGDSIKEAISKNPKKITISTAESLTGGLISSLITDTPGSSEYFLGSVISYSNFAKVKILGVDKNLISKEGAVSPKVCGNMAKKAIELFSSDFAVSATGIAGPDLIEKDKHVGLVYAGIAGPGGFEKIYEKEFIGTRADIKFRTAQFILNKLRLVIKEFK